ncbi:hypothetical protein Vqi01_16670 [Micromonospora qiuiae]|uniref:DUF202 domain-containing protein n=1 Tax=Micromonospora qiuiae TaxID=502268 RepID=A0ABQ4J8L1_9ACTN|nr:hypothetical protein Vqi01_16670 [Micromonospora qiuiae]
MTTVTRETGPHQPGDPLSTDNRLIRALMMVATMSIGAVLWIALAYRGQMDTVGQTAITVIGGVGLAAISAITVVLRRRPPRRRS